MRLHEEALQAILKGVRLVAEAVSPLLGPSKRGAAIQDERVRFTRSSLLVIQHLELRDPFENMGVQLIKEAALRTHHAVGDGIVTTVVLADAIFTEGVHAAIRGACPLEMRKGIEKAVAHVCRFWDETATLGPALDQTLEIEGGLLSPYFVTNPDDVVAELEHPRIAVVDRDLLSASDVAPFLNRRKKEPLLILAKRVGKEAIATCTLNRVKGGNAVCLVKTATDLQKIAAWTGAKLVHERFSPAMLGDAHTVSINREKTVLRGKIHSRIHAGGGVSFLRAASRLPLLPLQSDQLVGAKLVCQACFTPTTIIASNCGEAGSLIAETVYARKKGWGYNAAAGKYADLMKIGIVDPIEVSQAALKNGAMVAASLLNVAALVAK